MTINKRAIKVLEKKFDFDVGQLEAAINGRYPESINYWANKAMETAIEIHALETVK
jgi:hypothetical protein